jgi:hypothetical protein|tara:strand:+ start:562 stop:696 length:135 start_codon:yes stop_codon:yes gene_type:complete
MFGNVNEIGREYRLKFTFYEKEFLLRIILNKIDPKGIEMSLTLT